VANVKRIRIEGDLPFNGGDEGMVCFLGWLNTPISGVRITWLGRSRLEPVENGGRLAFYAFRLEGEEALSWGWISSFKESVIRCGGRITSDHVTDLEAGG